MELVLPANDPVADHWLDPLREALDRAECDYAGVEDFIPRAVVVRPRQPDVIQYRHRATGLLLYVDYRGFVYRERPGPEKYRSDRLSASTLDAELASLRTQPFDPPKVQRPGGRPALRLIRGGIDA